MKDWGTEPEPEPSDVYVLFVVLLEYDADDGG